MLTTRSLFARSANDVIAMKTIARIKRLFGDELISNDFSVFHHKLNALELGNISERITGHFVKFPEVWPQELTQLQPPAGSSRQSLRVTVFDRPR